MEHMACIRRSDTIFNDTGIYKTLLLTTTDKDVNKPNRDVITQRQWPWVRARQDWVYSTVKQEQYKTIQLRVPIIQVITSSGSTSKPNPVSTCTDHLMIMLAMICQSQCYPVGSVQWRGRQHFWMNTWWKAASNTNEFNLAQASTSESERPMPMKHTMRSTILSHSIKYSIFVEIRWKKTFWKRIKWVSKEKQREVENIMGNEQCARLGEWWVVSGERWPTPGLILATHPALPECGRLSIKVEPPLRCLLCLRKSSLESEHSMNLWKTGFLYVLQIV